MAYQTPSVDSPGNSRTHILCPARASRFGSAAVVVARRGKNASARLLLRAAARDSRRSQGVICALLAHRALIRRIPTLAEACALLAHREADVPITAVEKRPVPVPSNEHRALRQRNS